MKTKTRTFFIDHPVARWAPAIVVMAAIWELSSQSTLPKPPGITALLFSIIGHFTAFGVLAVCLWWALSSIPSLLSREVVIYSIGLATLYGIIDELHQLATPGRESDIRDVLTDLAGAVVFVAILKLVVRITESRKS